MPLPAPARVRRRIAYRSLLIGLLAASMAVPAWALSASQTLAAAAADPALAAPEARVEFVTAAVSEMILAIEAAAAAPQAKAWRRGTRGYVAQLSAAAAAAQAGSAVRFVSDAEGVLRVLVGSQPARQFMITAPRPQQRRQLESAIMSRYCRQRACGTPTGAQPITVASTDPRTPPTPASAPAPGSAGDGLICATGTARHRRLYDGACTALLADIRALAASLRTAVVQGARIDWTALAAPAPLLPVAARLARAAGASAPVTLPALAQAPELMTALVPWLQARLSGRSQPLAISPPARLVYTLPVALTAP